MLNHFLALCLIVRRFRALTSQNVSVCRRLKNLQGSALSLLTSFVLSACAFNDSEAPPAPNAPESSIYSLPADYKAHQALQQRFKSTSGEIAYTDHGSGRVLVLLHGVPTSSWMYRKIIPSLQTSLRVISVDLLGYGSSAKPQDDPEVYKPERQATMVKELLTYLNVDDYALAVHDMGGLVGWSLMRDDDRVSDLIVMNTIVHNEGFEQPELEDGMFTELLTESMSSTFSGPIMLSKTFASMGLDLKSDLSEEEAQGYIIPVQDGSDEAIYAFYTLLDERFLDSLSENSELFEQFPGNTLVLWGEQDNTLTVRQIPFLQQHLRIPDDRVKIFTANGHFLTEEIPEIVASEITRFLK